MWRRRAKQLIRTQPQSVSARAHWFFFVRMQQMARRMHLRRRTIAFEPGRDRFSNISSLTSSAGGCPAVLRAPRWRRYESGSTQGVRRVCARPELDERAPGRRAGVYRAGGAVAGADGADRPGRHGAAERVDRLAGVPVAQEGAAAGDAGGTDQPTWPRSARWQRGRSTSWARRSGSSRRPRRMWRFSRRLGRCSRRPTRTRRCW